MQTTIEEKLTELTIEQKLEAIKIVSKQKDDIDQMLSDLNSIPLAQVECVTLSGQQMGSRGFPLGTGSPIIVLALRKYLNERRLELISQAKELMKSN